MMKTAFLVLLPLVSAAMTFTAGTTHFDLNTLVDSCSQSGGAPVICGDMFSPLNFSARGQSGWLFADAAADWPIETGDLIGATASFTGSLTVMGRHGDGILAIRSDSWESQFSRLELHLPPNYMPCPTGLEDLVCFRFTYGLPMPISASASVGISEAPPGVRAAFIVLYASVLDLSGQEIQKFAYNDGFASDVLNVGQAVPEPWLPTVGIALIIMLTARKRFGCGS